MIIEAILNPFFSLIMSIISSLPNGSITIPQIGVDSFALLSEGLKFFPSDMWFLIIGNVMFWLTAHFTWACIEWLYKKIPGVD